MERNELLERIKGCLIGCAYGDAMGMPSEMMKPELIKELFPDGISKLEPSTSRDFIGRRFKAGEVTDDTVNTILCFFVLRVELKVESVMTTAENDESLPGLVLQGAATGDLN